jgi:hypothetical protein
MNVFASRFVLLLRAVCCVSSLVCVPLQAQFAPPLIRLPSPPTIEEAPFAVDIFVVNPCPPSVGNRNVTVEVIGTTISIIYNFDCDIGLLTREGYQQNIAIPPLSAGVYTAFLFNRLADGSLFQRGGLSFRVVTAAEASAPLRVPVDSPLALAFGSMIVALLGVVRFRTRARAAR